MYGAGGHGTVVADAALAAGRVVEFFLDDMPKAKTAIGLPVHASASIALDRFPDRDFIVGIGDNATRERVFRTLKAAGVRIVTIIHPSATVSRFASVGEGAFVAGGAVINPNATVAENCIINTCASVDHDCRVGASTHLCPGVHLAGGVTIGAGSILGTGCAAIPGISVGSWCTIGAGSVIVHNIEDNAIADGVPAKVRTSR